MMISVALPAVSCATAVLRTYLFLDVPISRNASIEESGTRLAVIDLSVARPKIRESFENSERVSGRTYSPWKTGPRALEVSLPPLPFFSWAAA